MKNVYILHMAAINNENNEKNNDKYNSSLLKNTIICMSSYHGLALTNPTCILEDADSIACSVG